MSIGKHLVQFISHPRARAVALLFLLHGLFISSWIAQIPTVKTKLQLGDAELGNVLLALPLGVIIMNSVAGWVLQKIGSWPSVLISFIGYSVLIEVVLATRTYWELFAALFLAGWAIGLMIVASNTLATRIQKSEDILILSSCHALFSLGAMVGASISSFSIANQFSAMYQIGIFIFMFIILIFSHKKYFQQIPEDLESAAGANFGVPNKELSLIILIGLAFAIGEGLVVDWSAVYLRDELGASEGMAPLAYATCALTMMLTRMSGDTLVAKLGTSRLLFIGGIIAFIGIMSMVLIPTPIMGIVGFGILGVGIALGVPLLMSKAAQAEGFSDGAGVGIFATFGFIGFIVEPPMVGWIAEWSNLGTGLSVVAGICLLGGILSLLLKR